MPADCFFDTSVLIYVLEQNDPRAAIAEALLAGGGQISVQVLNELAAVAQRKLGLSWKETLDVLSAIRELCEEPLPLTISTHEQALSVAQRYRYHIYDSLVIAAALECGCSVLYSEDMQDGQRIGSLRIRNPFRT